jgi:hypothetical protein
MDESGPGRHLEQLNQAAKQILFNMPFIKGAQDQPLGDVINVGICHSKFMSNMKY